MSRWERFIHSEFPDKLVQLALLHAEFEALHPFLDGNGRIGRMFVPLYLFSIGALQSPMFYISGYLEARRDEYYERLLAVSRDGDWTGWCIFFLKALIEQAQENHEKASAILNLYETDKIRCIELTRSRYAIRSLDFLFKRPVFTAQAFVHDTEMTKATAIRILKILRQNGILKEIKPAEGRNPALLAFDGLLDLVEGRRVV